MPRGLSIDVSVEGFDRAMARVEGVEERMRNIAWVADPVFNILEEGERRHFAGLHGRYVRTGATRASLTQPNANGAIRRVHGGDMIDFGTSIWYAKFLRRGKRSAVLVLKPKERKQVAQAILTGIVGPDGTQSLRDAHGGGAGSLSVHLATPRRRRR